MERMKVATMLRAERGTRSWALHPAALPRGTEQLLVHGPDETPVGIADDEPDARQAALDEASDEGRPGAALVVARGQLQAEDATLTGQVHPDGHEGGHVHDAAVVADLHVRGIEPQVRVVLTFE
jgi:hypothetical protein